MLKRVHFSQASTENTLTVTRSGESLCVSAVASASSGEHRLSVDGGGRLYRGDSCSGAVLEQFDTAAPADSTSS
jgi:hypothetical protein